MPKRNCISAKIAIPLHHNRKYPSHARLYLRRRTLRHSPKPCHASQTLPVDWHRRHQRPTRQKGNRRRPLSDRPLRTNPPESRNPPRLRQTPRATLPRRPQPTTVAETPLGTSLMPARTFQNHPHRLPDCLHRKRQPHRRRHGHEIPLPPQLRGRHPHRRPRHPQRRHRRIRQNMAGRRMPPLPTQSLLPLPHRLTTFS